MITRKKLKQILLDEGYSENTVKKYLQGNGKNNVPVPTLRKAIKLEKKYSVPCLAWENINLFLSNREIINNNTDEINYTKGEKCI